MESESWEQTQWLLGGAGVAIAGEAAFIAKLIFSKATEMRESLAASRAEWESQCDKSLAQLQEQLNAEKAEKLAVIKQRDEIQKDYLEFVKTHGREHDPDAK